MAPRKTTKKSSRRSVKRSGANLKRTKKTTTKKAARSARISNTQAKGFGSFLQERYE